MKKIIVTDPCYILSGKKWDELSDKYPDTGEFFQALSKTLQEISGDRLAVAGPTKVGDWENYMHGGGVVESEFGADSGCVCVVQMTDKLSEYWNNHGSPVMPDCVAVLDNVPDEAFYELNFLGEVTKVNIWNGDFSDENLLATSVK